MKRQHETKPGFHCTKCDKVFKLRSILQRHMATTHKIATDGEEWLECEVCSMKFLGKRSLQVHRRWHFEEKPKSTHHCPEPKCSFTADSKWKLTQHVNGIHLKKRPFKCEVCGADFKRKYHLQVHNKNVHSDATKSFKCDKCDYASNELRWLKNHINAVHLGLRPFKCETCGSTFTQKPHLITHMKNVHLDLRGHILATFATALSTKEEKKRKIV